MSENGALQTSALAGQQVSPLEEASANPNVQLNVSGTPLQTFGGDYVPPDLMTVAGLGKDVKDTISLAAQAGAVISGVAGVVNFVIGALKMVGAIEEDNPYDLLFNRIDKSLQAILQATQTGSVLSTMQNIRDIVGESESSATFAVQHISAKYPQDTFSLNRLALADKDSLDAMNTLSGDAYWLRIYDEPSIVGPWMSGIPARPVVSQNLVWDYRLALPAWLKCLIVRLAVIEAIDPLHKNLAFRDEILGYATFTRQIEGRMRAGIATAVLPIGEAQFPFFAKFHAQPCGAVDLHSGLSDYQPFYPWLPADEIEMLVRVQQGAPDTFEVYKSQHESVTNARFWRLYRAMGLLGFWQLTPDLEAMAAKYVERPYVQPYLPGMYEQVSGTHSDFTQQYSQLVIREIARRPTG